MAVPAKDELNRDKFKPISSSLSNPENGQRSTAYEVAAEMSFVHNLLIRGISAIYVQCVNVATRGSAQDKLDFVNFAKAWSNFIHEHHEFEETVAFPDINRVTGQDGLMDANIEEHEVFHAGLHEFQEYIRNVQAEKIELDGARMRLIIDGFMPVLRKHLENEIYTLIDLQKFEDKVDWSKWFAKMLERAMSNTMKDPKFKAEVFPLMFCLHDRTFENGVWSDKPPVPWLVAVFMRWMYMSVNKGWWRFAPCDLYGQPKELPFE